MQHIDFANSLVVGIDNHKRSHTAVLVTPFCQTIAQYEFDNSEEKIDCFLDDVVKHSSGKKVIFALEDVNCYGFMLSRHILKKGFQVFNVPAIYTERDRKRTSHIDKSDALDAKGVARVLLTKSDSIPPQFMVSEKTELSIQLKRMIADRRQLVKQNTKLKNQLHSILHELFGDKYEEIVTYRNIFCPMAVKQWIEKLQSKDGYTSRRALVKFQTLQLVYKELSILEEELKAKSNEDVELVESIPGCGNPTACAIIAEIGDIKRFRSPAALAKYCGLAPREHSSGETIRHFVDRRGNRKLNNAIHRLAFGQLGSNCKGPGKKYFEKKVKEGKSKLSALRCLKRKLIDVIFQILTKQEEYKFFPKPLNDLTLAA